MTEHLNNSTAAARGFVAGLISAGVTEAVVAPGSRNGPLSLALVAADAAGSIRLHVRHDERSASFLALGLASVSQRPVAVVVTSGSAGAHLAPAAVEATQAGIPLLLITADRPAALVGTGANQTIPQRDLLIGTGAQFIALPENDDADYQHRAWFNGARSAVGVAWHGPGPVHVNAPFVEPLAPTSDWVDVPAPVDVEVPGRGEAAPAAKGWDAAGRRGVVLVGPGPGVSIDVAASIGRALGFPVLAEPATAPWPSDVVMPHAPLVSRRHLDLDPDVVIAIGRVGLSRAEAALLRDRDVIAIAPPPGVTRVGARTVLPRVPSAAAIASEAATATAPTGWLQQWQTAAVETGAHIVEVLVGHPTSSLALARAVVSAVPNNGLLHLAASLPARDVATVATNEAGSPWADGNIRVTMNRGANGIDGMASTAIGAALAWQRAGGGRAIAYMGDVATLHDLPGFIVSATEPTPDLTFVISDNDGGGIFSTLEQADATGFERVFGTPHQRDLAVVLSALGVPCVRVTVDALADHIATPSTGLRAFVVTTLAHTDEAAVRTELLSANLAP
jgi:2-succinyl-5-enolpyruvyl-6-hydroxy-3-cyclohexene-1-carboxylate synthase